MEISLTATGGKIRWDGSDWLSSLLPQFSTSSGYTRITTGKGFTNTVGIDPFRYPGFCSPGNSASAYTSASTYIDSTVLNAVNNGSTAYLIGASTKITSADLSTNTVSALRTIAGSGAHAAHSSIVGNDVALYYVGTSKYLFYSYSDNTDGDVGRFDLTSTYVDNYMSGTAASGAVLTTKGVHPLIVGSDDVLYIGDGNVLAGFDGQNGANGTFYPTKLALPKDYIITSYSKTANYLVIYAYKNTVGGSTYSADSTAFFWDYISADPTYSIPLQGSYVNGGFSYQGVAGCFIQGGSTNLDNSKSSRMVLYDGTGFKPVCQFPEGIPTKGGVVAIDDMVYWNAEGVIYRYGTPHLGFNKGLNRISVVGSASGLLKNFVSNKLSASGSASISYLDGGYYPTAEFYTPFVTIPFKEEHRGKVKTIKVYWYSIPGANCNPFSLFLKTETKNTTTVLSSKTTITTNVPGDGTSELFNMTSSNTALPVFDYINVFGTWSAGSDTTAIPLIPEAIEVYFEYTKI